MEHLYNPSQMSEQEIKDTFVARQALLSRLVALIRRQPNGAGVQHIVLLAPRGMGKTTMLLMLQFAVEDQHLNPPWLAIQFPEELYGINDLADFWLETLTDLAISTGDLSLMDQIQNIKDRYPESKALQEAALALLRGWCQKHERRLLLLVDNFHQILSLLDEQQAAAMRNVLMNEGFLMILGAATSFFKEASNYDEPLYNFFRVEHLERLHSDDMRTLLIQRAAADGIIDFEKNLDANATRLRALEYFTGGNIRLVLMLYRVVAQSALLEVRQGLDKLLDQVTPFYKAKTEDLPPQQRKILDHIARTSGQTREGASPSDIAQAVRLTPQVVSAQLKRLTDTGYVQSANLRGRSTSYTISEPLYSLWYQMRFGRNARQRMGWLVGFLKGFYTVEELSEQSQLLEDQFHNMMSEGRVTKAHSALEYRRWLAEAMPDRSYSAKAMDSIIHGYLALNDISTLKDQVLTEDQLEYLSPSTLNELLAAGCITDERVARARDARGGSTASKLAAEVDAALLLGIEAEEQNDFDQALAIYDRALVLNKNDIALLNNRTNVLNKLSRYEEALSSIDSALSLNENESRSWYNRGTTLSHLGRYEEAVMSYDRSIVQGGGTASDWFNRGNALVSLGRYDEALSSFDHAIELDPKKIGAWGNKGNLLNEQGRCEEAITSYDQILALDRNDAVAWNNRGNALVSLGRYEEALSNFDQALLLNENYEVSWYNRGNALDDLGRYEEALSSFDRALALDENYTDVWNNQSIALRNLGRYEEALNSLDRALALDGNRYTAWENRGIILFLLGRREEAVDSFDRALALNENSATTWENRGVVLSLQDRHAEAVMSYVRALIAASEHGYDKDLIPRVHLAKFGSEAAIGHMVLAAEDWHAAVLDGAIQDNLMTYATQHLLAIAKQGQGSFVRELIASSHTEDQFFPIARALDYIATGNEALIEKLTPEIRPIVEEVVAVLRPAAEYAGDTSHSSSRRRKKSSLPKHTN